MKRKNTTTVHILGILLLITKKQGGGKSETTCTHVTHTIRPAGMGHKKKGGGRSGKMERVGGGYIMDDVESVTVAIWSEA